MRKLILLTLMLLLIPVAAAITFNNEVIESDITDFKWCFDNPWEYEKPIYNDEWYVYQDNIGCDDVDGKLYMEYKYETVREECETVYECNTEEQYFPGNKTTGNVTTCERLPDSCVNRTQEHISYYDVKENDVMIRKTDRLCYIGERKASTTGKCDMNFDYSSKTNTSESFRAVEYNKAWWNTTWQVKHLFNWTACTNGTRIRFRTTWNDTAINFSDFQADGGDVRIVNYTEDDTIPFNLTTWNSTTGIIHINASCATAGAGYLYGNATSTVSTTSQDISHVINESTGVTLDSTFVNTGWRGMNLTVGSDNISLAQVHKGDPSTITNVTIKDSLGNTVLGHGGFTDNASNLGERVELLASTSYLVMGHANGGSADHWYEDAGISYPYAGTLLNFVGSPWDADGDPPWTANAAYVYHFIAYQIEHFGINTMVVNTRESLVPVTSIDSGLFNRSLINISTSIDERVDFTPWVNWTYDINSSEVGNATGYCNYSADEIVDPHFEFTAGTNDTICDSGCDFTNKTVTLTGLDVEDFISDQYEITICHGGNPRQDAILSTNCSEQYTIDRFDFPLCDAGDQMIRITSGNCSGETDVEVSIWSDGTTSLNPLTVVNQSVRLDRTHNHSENMTWNATSEVWSDDDFHHYDITGAKTIYFTCFDTSGDVGNASDSLSITVGDVAPTVFIDSIWWWLLSIFQFFDDDEIAKYPLESTINITSSCSDGDVHTIIHYLNYSNGTNINTHNAGDTNVVMNYTQSNFSDSIGFLNNSVGYTFQTWCNDTGGNVATTSKNFTAENDVPVVAWSNSTPLIITTAPAVLNWTFTDDENVVVSNCFLFINNTNLSDPNVTGTGLGYEFNLIQNTYNFSVRCQDAYQNSTMQTLILTFTQAITANITQPQDSVSYLIDGTTLNWQFTVLTAPDNCTYRLNDFQNITVANCTSGVNNITFIDGFNEWNVCFHSSSTTDECVVTRFWVQDSDRELDDYMPILLWILIIVLMFIMGEFIKMPFIQLLTGFMFIIFIVYWWAFFNTWYIPIIFTFIGIVLIMRSVAILWTD